LERHKGPTLGVLKCRYFFGESGRRDITQQNICGMKNLEDGSFGLADLRPQTSDLRLSAFDLPHGVNKV